MNGWDYLAGANCILGGMFLVIHAVMVGNPQYGWQPRSLIVRSLMVVSAVFLAARGYTVLALHSPVEPTGQWAAASLAGMFFVAWLDMMVASWKRAAAEDKDRAVSKAAEVVRLVGHKADRAEKAANAALAKSSENGEKLDRVAGVVSILEPAPQEFKDQIGLTKTA